NYYVAELAPALAALVGIGAAQVLRGGRRSWLFAAAAAVATAWLQFVLLRRVHAWEWLRPGVPIAVVAGAIVVLLATVLRPRVSRLPRAAAGAMLVALAVAPLAWSVAG